MGRYENAKSSWRKRKLRSQGGQKMSDRFPAASKFGEPSAGGVVVFEHPPILPEGNWTSKEKNPRRLEGSLLRREAEFRSMEESPNEGCPELTGGEGGFARDSG